MKLYLIGDKDAAKRNSWLAVTSCHYDANRIMNSTPEATQIKTITPRKRRG